MLYVSYTGIPKVENIYTSIEGPHSQEIQDLPEVLHAIKLQVIIH